MLQKSVYPYEYMNDWKNVSEPLLLEKENFYSNLKVLLLKNVNEHAAEIWRELGIKNLCQ